MRTLLLVCTLVLPLHILGQSYVDYLGAGHNNGINVRTSHNDQSISGDHTVDGFGFMPDIRSASRFLAQSSWGGDYEKIQAVAQLGYSEWLDQQFALPHGSFLQETQQIFNDIRYQLETTFGTDSTTLPDIIPHVGYFRLAWWHKMMVDQDQLRHRIALALSEIFVISYLSELGDSGYAIADFYDVLYRNAFGNYRQLLYDVTMHPSMGFYLSHLNNPKTDYINNTHPDENFAREIMQLFSIGLYELHPNGNRKTDANGQWIPSYNNQHIKEYAKIFTGLKGGEHEDYNGDVPFGTTWYALKMWKPMEMEEGMHEYGTKYLLNNTVVPAGQTGMQDINMAIDNLFNHPNTGPFIGRKLIQFLVKSNPSPDYIERVAAAFADNGEGVRGDMKALIRAILLDPEARNCEWIHHAENGKLREPIIRYIHLLKAFNASNPIEKYWTGGHWIEEALRQHPMASPSVFNFFLPDYQPNGPISNADLVGPEFQLHNSVTSIVYSNMLLSWTIYEDPYKAQVAVNPEIFGDIIPTEASQTRLNIDDEIAIANTPSMLVNRLDIILTHGTLSNHTKNVIIDAVNQISENEPKLRVNLALYLILLSPDYTILK